ncbi:MAG: carbon-nitrogen hydrolase family protein [Pseudomonadota bacterium]
MKVDKVKIGMGQLLVEGGEPERNLKRALDMMKKAALLGCDILLLPECLDLGWTHPSALSEAQTIPGPYSKVMCDNAKENKIYVCCGLTEFDGGKVYNCAILIDSSGEIILKYRKINVLDVAFKFYAIGQNLSVVETPFGRIGVNICSDNYNDALDIGYVLGRMGAQIILSPSSWTVDCLTVDCKNPYGDKWLKPFKTLSKMFNMVVVNATSVGVILGGPYEGKKSVGCSLAVGPEGKDVIIIKQGGYNEFAGELVVAEVNVPEPYCKGTDIGKMLVTKKGLLTP